MKGKFDIILVMKKSTTIPVAVVLAVFIGCVGTALCIAANAISAKPLKAAVHARNDSFDSADVLMMPGGFPASAAKSFEAEWLEPSGSV